MWRFEYPPGSGRTRRVRVGEVPLDWAAHAPLPVVVVLHDEHSNVDAITATDDPDDTNAIGAGLGLLTVGQSPETFVMLMPEGSTLGRLLDPDDASLGDEASWNSGHRGFEGLLLGADDTGFIEHAILHVRDLLESMLARHPPPTGAVPSAAVDLDRIYVVGVGNGGMMAYRLACELPSRPTGLRIRGMVVIGGTGGGYRYTSDLTGGVASNGNVAPPWKNNPNNRQKNPVAPKAMDLLVIHGELDDNVAMIPPAGENGTTSVAEIERLTDEVGAADLAAGLAPWDYGLDNTIDAWREFFLRRTGTETPAVAADTQITLVDVDGVQHDDLKLTAWTYVARWGGADTTVTLAKLVDPQAAQGVPRWATPELLWLFLTNSTSLLS